MPDNMFKNVEFPDPMDLRLAAIYIGVSEGRVRSLSREGKIGTKAEGGKWQYAKKELDAYLTAPKAARKTGAPHGEGKAFVVRIKFQDMQSVKDFLATKGISLEPRYNYDNQKKYQAKRKAAKAAEKAAKAASAPAGTAAAAPVVKAATANPLPR